MKEIGKMNIWSISNKWEIDEGITHDGCVEFRIRCGGISGHHIIVKPPSWIERLRGITFEQKVKKARAKMALECAKRNAAIVTAKGLIIEHGLDTDNPPRGGSGVPRLPKKAPIPSVEDCIQEALRREE